MVSRCVIYWSNLRGCEKWQRTVFSSISYFVCLYQVNQILCCIAWRPDWANEVIDLAYERRENKPCAIVGVDIAAGEEHFDKVGKYY